MMDKKERLITEQDMTEDLKAGEFFRQYIEDCKIESMDFWLCSQCKTFVNSFGNVLPPSIEELSGNDEAR